VAWLLREGDVLASLEVADSRARRRRGLLGRDGIDGALLLRPARSVHTIGMRFPVDVAWCDRDLVVLRTARLGRHRVSRPLLRAHAVVEAEAGAFARWGLAAGDRLELRDEHPDEQA
jgi:uncharacterized membrane protein (UPF0127 family)